MEVSVRPVSATPPPISKEPEPWIWKQSAGELWRDGKLIAKGYAGAPGHVNKTESEGLRNLGPIPRGWWKMTTYYPTHPKLGPIAIRLEPVGHNALGRSAFLIHADSIKRPGAASEGCIILDYATRLMLCRHEERRIHVV